MSIKSDQIKKLLEAVEAKREEAGESLPVGGYENPPTEEHKKAWRRGAVFGFDNAKEAILRVCLGGKVTVDEMRRLCSFFDTLERDSLGLAVGYFDATYTELDPTIGSKMAHNLYFSGVAHSYREVIHEIRRLKLCVEKEIGIRVPVTRAGNLIVEAGGRTVATCPESLDGREIDSLVLALNSHQRLINASVMVLNHLMMLYSPESKKEDPLIKEFVGALEEAGVDTDPNKSISDVASSLVSDLLEALFGPCAHFGPR